MARAADIVDKGGYWEHKREGQTEWSLVVETPDLFASLLEALLQGRDVRRWLKLAESPHPDIPLVNAQRLDAHAVGDGYRLLLPWELDGRFAHKAEVWSVSREFDQWVPAAHCRNNSYTYRLPVSTPWSPPPEHFVPPDGRPLHNPAGLNSWQVGDNMRLLLREEVGERWRFKKLCWRWDVSGKRWIVDAEQTDAVGGYDQTYCVRQDEPWLAVPKPQHWTASDFVPGTYGSSCTMEECGNGLVHPPRYFPLVLLTPYDCNGMNIGYNYKGWRQFTFEDFAATHIVCTPGGKWQKPFKTQQ